MARQDFARRYPVQVEFIRRALVDCRAQAMGNLPDLARRAAKRYPVSPVLLEEYFRALRHEFDGVSRRALLRYYAHAQICGLIPPKVTLRVWGEDPV
ncbi:hypothetical protein Desku_1549 [Calderihabitans maritimus]|uniref:Uncharacterized protein n=1 Tax=Calderihabitans maritimus TaxID=1246530 RepID=A0A1Z5HXN6_9FIRM|nr:hypothetical protein Desku_1549 [Calderihabitans maritimus]